MKPRRALLSACVLCTLAMPVRAPAQPAPGAPDAKVAPEVDEALEAELARLQGQRVRRVDRSAPQSAGPSVGPGDGQSAVRSDGRGPGYVIEDVAGEGAPVVGVVEQRPGALWLAGDDGVAYRLAGVLARPRIAGPGYKIWVLGTVIVQRGENVLRARRLGILAPPWRVQARAARSTILAISAGAPTRTGGPQ
jgi:hypothetical protein